MDIISDFYKRFEKNGICVNTLFCPAVVPLLGIDDDLRAPVLSLSLSFGTLAASRRRNDDRIVIERTDTDDLQAANFNNIAVFNGKKWAKDIMRSINSITTNPNGIEILLHNDTGIPEFSDYLLCSASVYANEYFNKDAPKCIIKATNSKPSQIITLLKNARFAVVNTSTLDYIPYNFNFDGYKIVLIKTNRPHKVITEKNFTLREKERINCAVQAIQNNNIKLLGECLSSSAADLMRANRKSKCRNIYSYVTEFSPIARPLNDFSGVIAIVNDEICDEMVKITGSRYEKKTGSKPAFYISD